VSAAVVRALAVAGSLTLPAQAVQRTGPTQAPRLPRPVTAAFTLHDSTLSGPATVTAGHVILKLNNRTTQPHQVALLRLPQGADPLTVLRGMRNTRRVTSEPGFTNAGGIGPLLPGDSGSLLLRLLPGRYLVYCHLNARDGDPYFRHGVATFFEATGPGVTQQPSETALSALLVTDAVMTFAQTMQRGDRRVPRGGTNRGTRLVRGRHSIQIDNFGGQGHAVVILRTVDLKAMSGYVAWLDGRSATVPPMVSGVPALPSGGQTVFLRLNLEPGAYTVFCPNHHIRTGMRGFQTGEFTQFVVS